MKFLCILLSAFFVLALIASAQVKTLIISKTETFSGKNLLTEEFDLK
jgi:hypothetical protein